MPGSPLRIIIVNDFAYVNGGAAQVALGSALELAQRGHEVILFSAVGPVADDLKNSPIRTVCLEQIDIARDPSRFRAATRGIWNREAATSMSKLLAGSDRSRTLVHLHGWTKALSSSVAAAALDTGYSTVVTMHDYFLACPNGGFFNYPANDKCHLRALSTECVLSNCDKHSYVQKLWRVGRQVIQNVDGHLPNGVKQFIAISRFSHRLLEPYLPVDAIVHPVANPIDITRQERTKPNKSTGLLFVGRLDPEKGGVLLAGAAKNAGVKVTFIGDGPQKEAITQANSEARFTGWLDRVDLRRELTATRALVLPSLWYETQGLVVLEAAACGIPAVVPDNCAASEMVNHEQTGLVFESGNEQSLVEQLKRLNDDALVESMSRAAYEQYWNNPSTMTTHVDRLEQVYADILAHS